MITNKFVDELNQYHPFRPSFGATIAERESDFEIPTRLDSALKEFTDDPDTKIVILTGDAGQGKTFACRSLLNHLK